MSLTTNIISYYPLATNSTDSVGFSNGNDNNISYSGGAVLNGSNSYIINSDLINIPLVTISVWLNLTSYPPGNGLASGFGNGVGSGTYDKEIMIDSLGRALFYAYDGGSKSTGTSAPLTTGVFHHIVGTADGTNLNLYVDGSFISSTPCGNTYTGYSVPDFLMGGNSGGANNYLTGTIKQVGLWSRALSAAEVTTLYNGGTPLPYPFTSTSNSGFLSFT